MLHGVPSEKSRVFVVPVCGLLDRCLSANASVGAVKVVCADPAQQVSFYGSVAGVSESADRGLFAKADESLCHPVGSGRIRLGVASVDALIRAQRVERMNNLCAAGGALVAAVGELWPVV